MNARPTSSTATANAMPTTDMSVRTGWRSRFRRIIRVTSVGRNRRHDRSKTLRW